MNQDHGPDENADDVGESVTSLVVVPTAASPELAAARASLARLDARAQESVDAAKAANTARAYALETACFASWATRHGVPAIPAEPRVVRAYLRELADKGRDVRDLPPQRQKRAPGGPLGYGSVMRALSAICTAHVKAGLPSLWKHPLIEEIRETIAKNKGEGVTQKNPIRTELLIQIVDAMGKDLDLRGLRDRAILLVGWQGGGRRRSEIVAAEVHHFADVDGGVHWTIPRSKTDQTGKGIVVPLPLGKTPAYCPVRALRAWLDASGIKSGYVFRSIDRFARVGDRPLTAEHVSLLVKRSVEALGLDPKLFAGHSIRSGFLHGVKGKPLADAMRASGHTKAETAIHYQQADARIEEAAVRGVVDAAVSLRPTSEPAGPPRFRRIVRPIGVEVEFSLSDAITPFFGAQPYARELLDLAHWIEQDAVELEVVSIKHSLGVGWADRFMSFRRSVRATGQEEHQTLCALGWMFVQEVLGIPCHSKGGSSCAYAGGWADVAAEDGSFFVECGTTSVEKVPRAMMAGQKVLVLPYGFSGRTVQKEDLVKLNYDHRWAIGEENSAPASLSSATDFDPQPGYLFTPKDLVKLKSIWRASFDALHEKRRRELTKKIAAAMPGLDEKEIGE